MFINKFSRKMYLKSGGELSNIRIIKITFIFIRFFTQ